MTTNRRDFCARAVASLRAEDDSVAGATIELAPADRPVSRALSSGLAVVYLVDVGERFEYVQERHLAEAGFTADELHAHALANLLALAESRVQVHAYGNVYAVVLDGHFEASLILLRGIWSEWWGELVPNGAVVAIPARDLLAFGDAASKPAVDELHALCARVRGQVDHPLTQRLYRDSPSGWSPLEA